MQKKRILIVLAGLLFTCVIIHVALGKHLGSRLILAICSGAALSASGAALQAMFQSPLADPYIVGVSGGAALMGALAMVLFPNDWSVFLPLFSMAGALIVSLSHLWIWRSETSLLT